MTTMFRVKYSVVVPLHNFHNEEGSIPLLYNSLVSVLAALEEDYEIIFVDDGSTDRSSEALKLLPKPGDRGHLQVISLARRFGKSAALQAGFDSARGEIIITLDGDLQDDPAETPPLTVSHWEGQSPRL